MFIEDGRKQQIPGIESFSTFPHTENIANQTDVVELSSPEILKHRVMGLVVWLGLRMYDDSDYEAFEQACAMYSRVHISSIFKLTDADKIKDPSDLEPVVRDLTRELNKANGPLAVFVVTTPRVAEYPWLNQLQQGVQDFRQKYTREELTRVYRIIMGGGSGFSDSGNYEWDDLIYPYERRSHDLGSVYLNFNGDYPSIGGHKLVEFMNRVVGMDLPGETFPDYSFDERKKIAWNIVREDFNTFSPRIRALPKYPIGEDGRPILDHIPYVLVDSSLAIPNKLNPVKLPNED